MRWINHMIAQSGNVPQADRHAVTDLVSDFGSGVALCDLAKALYDNPGGSLRVKVTRSPQSISERNHNLSEAFRIFQQCNPKSLCHVLPQGANLFSAFQQPGDPVLRQQVLRFFKTLMVWHVARAYFHIEDSSPERTLGKLADRVVAWITATSRGVVPAELESPTLFRGALESGLLARILRDEQAKEALHEVPVSLFEERETTSGGRSVLDRPGPAASLSDPGASVLHDSPTSPDTHSLAAPCAALGEPLHLTDAEIYAGCSASHFLTVMVAATAVLAGEKARVRRWARALLGGDAPRDPLDTKLWKDGAMLQQMLLAVPPCRMFRAYIRGEPDSLSVEEEFDPSSQVLKSVASPRRSPAPRSATRGDSPCPPTPSLWRVMSIAQVLLGLPPLSGARSWPNADAKEPRASEVLLYVAELRRLCADSQETDAQVPDSSAVAARALKAFHQIGRAHV